MRVLLLNAGSSSLKVALLESEAATLVAQASADWAGRVTRWSCAREGERGEAREVPWRGHAAAVRHALDALALARPGAAPAAVGHRIVHGGEFRRAVRIGPEVRARIAALAELAPLHNPPGLETLAAAEAALPDTPHVAVFDTAFHATLAPAARHYALPERWGRDWGIRRFGFHGLSHAYCARRAAALLARPLEALRLVICHLGHGCSATAVRDGRSLDTTMGFTPLDGLVMATRSGAVDPGIVAHVQLRHGLSAAEVEHALNHDAGLLGLSGVSGDMREVLAAAHAGNERARLAFDVYAHRVRAAIGALAATLGGVDALVFTAGVGQHSAELRAAACAGLDFLGLALDPEANAAARSDADVSRPGARGRILVLETREDLTMLEDVVAEMGR